MKINSILIKTILSQILALLLCITAAAQKLPNVQKNSIYAPANTTIDGKANEWGNKFEAFNRATGVYYTIANDDSRLYIVLRATDALIIKKILHGNITFTIGTSVKDDKSPGLKITFPSFSEKDRNDIIANKNQVVINSKSAVVNQSNDSLITILNAQIIDKSAIKIKGMPTLPDSSISIDKNSDIKGTSVFGKDYAYTYELAIPLKYLETVGIKDGTISYNIKLNGTFYNTNTSVLLSADGQYMSRSTPGSGSVEFKAEPENIVLDFPTYFSGKYTLAKKP